MNDDINIMAEADNGKQLLNELTRYQPDIVMMDISMPELNGMDTLEIMMETFPYVKVIMLSMYDDKEYILNMIHAGAARYLLKDISGEEMMVAIHKVHEGGKYFSNEITEVLAQENPRNNKILTTREQLVLRLISHGNKNKDIAKTLEISARAVETHMSNIKQKLNLDCISGLVRYAIQH